MAVFPAPPPLDLKIYEGVATRLSWLIAIRYPLLETEPGWLITSHLVSNS